MGFDFIFLGVPALGGLLLLAGSVYQGIKLKRLWYLLPALFGLNTLVGMVGVMTGSAHADIGCVMGFGFLLIGAAVYWILQRQDRKHVEVTTNSNPPE